MRDTGARPPLPYGWPALDSDLVAAVSDLRRLDSLTETLLRGLPEDRDPETVPGYAELESAREAVLAVLVDVRAEGLPGLQAKAKALLTEGVVNNQQATADLAHSIGCDLTGARSDIVEPQADPVFAAIKEQRRLCREHDALFSQLGEDWDRSPVRPAEIAANAAAWEHWRDVVLKTVPRTATGCRALAAYASEFAKDMGTDLDAEGPAILGLIARSPLL
ncbi:hypothetical protein DA075_35500 (plasmid) [Methylobacterium currus]|uniref:Uncharacterized protein n=1 Tax=Methylobacterium currus TaxID=2051553 RepID=A0A2R4WXA2_9HYPH|nr:hypothetical protein [Methylobacterium currus]AWB26179.1 hypothetical protein DA075_35500 [Methylobacterium currus]